MNKGTFYSLLYHKIADAFKACDKGNVIDMRLYKSINGCFEQVGIYGIFDVDGLYDAITKDDSAWFVDFYENIKGTNSAEFMDIALFSTDTKKVDMSAMFERYNKLSIDANQAENDRRKYVAKLVETIQKNSKCEYLVFTDETSYPIFYDETTGESDYIVGAKAVDGTLYITTDSSFSDMSWFDWTHYGTMELDDFVYVLEHNLA